MKYLIGLVLAVVSSVTAAQESREPSSAPPLLSTDDLVVQQYRPQNLTPESLYHSVRGLMGREIYVAERGGYNADPIDNVRFLGKLVIVCDTSEYGERVLAMCEKLDAASEQEVHASEMRTFSYRLRYLDLPTLDQLLVAFGRLGRDKESSVSFLPNQGMLVVRDTPERVAEVEELLARADRPQPQVLVTCYLLEGAGAAGTGNSPRDVEGVPAELAAHLGALVPGMNFERVGFGMLRTSPAAGDVLSLDLNGGQSRRYSFTFRPIAFDEETGSLSVQECGLTRFDSVVQSIFKTSTLLRGGEYTVLGASGEDPILLAVRVTPVTE